MCGKKILHTTKMINLKQKFHVSGYSVVDLAPKAKPAKEAIAAVTPT